MNDKDAVVKAREPKWPLFGYAPGHYMITCSDCGETVWGVDKRAIQCLACAVEAAKRVAVDFRASLAAAPSTSVREEVVRPFAEWHEDYGSVLWWRLPIQEPPYVGTPLDLGRAMKVVVQVGVEEHDLPATMTGGWPFDEDDETRLFWTALPDAGAIASLAALKPSTDKGGVE